jgi:hypothetical protein
MYKIYLDTKRREECLKVNYTVETIWECDAKKNEEFMNFYKNGTFVSPLDPKDAFFGGRTNATK